MAGSRAIALQMSRVRFPQLHHPPVRRMPDRTDRQPARCAGT